MPSVGAVVALRMDHARVGCQGIDRTSGLSQSSVRYWDGIGGRGFGVSGYLVYSSAALGQTPYTAEVPVIGKGHAATGFPAVGM